MAAKEELTTPNAEQYKVLLQHVVQVNKNLIDRAVQSGFTFDLDRETDTFTITFGGAPRDTYTQGFDHLFADLDLQTDEIIGFTILQFETAFMKTREGKRTFGKLLPVLREYGSIGFPPKGRGTGRAASELKTLVPALF